MTYNEFTRQLGKAGISVRRFAQIMGMNPNSVTNCAQRDGVPSHLAVIAVLMGLMAENDLDFEGPILDLEIPPKKPRGKSAFRKS